MFYAKAGILILKSTIRNLDGPERAGQRRYQMGGKASGKKRNRAAQGEPHGYHERPSDIASGAENNGGQEAHDEKQRTIDKLRELEQRQRDKEGGK
jgi:hypothetical protein